MLDLAFKDEILEIKLRSKHMLLQIRSTYKFNLQYDRSKMYYKVTTKNSEFMREREIESA
jgi:hypothetical protein